MWIALSCIVLTGCATGQSQSSKIAPTVDVTGTWAGEWPGSFATIPFTMTLKQANADVTGDIAFGGGTQQHSMVSSGPINGSVSGDTFSFWSPRGAGGDATVKATEMRGTTRTGQTLLMRRQ
jgi:hypothetical protein